MWILLCDYAVFKKYQRIYMFDNIKAFTRWMHFFMQIICTKNISWTADWAWIFSHKMQISCSEKAILQFFRSRSILHFRTVKKHIRLLWLCRADITFIYHNNLPTSDRLQDFAPGRQPPKRCCSVFSDEQLESAKVLSWAVPPSNHFAFCVVYSLSIQLGKAFSINIIFLLRLRTR